MLDHKLPGFGGNFYLLFEYYEETSSPERKNEYKEHNPIALDGLHISLTTIYGFVAQIPFH